MKCSKNLAVFCALLGFGNVACAADYKMIPESEQPHYSRNPDLDYLVKEFRKDMSLSVDAESLKNATKYSDIKGKRVLSNDEQEVGKVFDILFCDTGEIILIISSGEGIPALDLGDTKRAVYAHNAYFSESKKDIYLLMDKDMFMKEPVVKEDFL